MTNGDHSSERDPLLVRPFVLRDSGALDAQEPTQTWPATATPPQPAVDDSPTAVLPLPLKDKPATTDPRRRRLVVMAGATTAVVLGAAAAGFAALRDDVRPMVSAGLPGDPVPAAVGPSPIGGSPSVPFAASTAVPGRPRASDAGNGKSPGATPTKRVVSSPTANGQPATGSSSAGQPIAITPAPSGGGKTTSPAGVAPAPPTSEPVGAIRGQNSLCLDLFAGWAIDGNHLQVFDCNESSAQTFTLAADGTLRVMGKCASAGRDRAVRIGRCDDRDAAQWRRDGQRLINDAYDDCLTDPSGGRRAGSGVRIIDCDGSASQRWSLP